MRLSDANRAQQPQMVWFRCEVNGKRHIKLQGFRAGVRVPCQGSMVRVRYEETKPSRATALF